jgi:hypothetical protein
MDIVCAVWAVTASGCGLLHLVVFLVRALASGCGLLLLLVFSVHALAGGYGLLLFVFSVRALMSVIATGKTRIFDRRQEVISNFLIICRTCSL